MKKSWPVGFGFYIRPVKKNCNLYEAHILIGLSITHDMGFSNLERERNHVVQKRNGTERRMKNEAYSLSISGKSLPRTLLICSVHGNGSSSFSSVTSLPFFSIQGNLINQNYSFMVLKHPRYQFSFSFYLTGKLDRIEAQGMQLHLS